MAHWVIICYFSQLNQLFFQDYADASGDMPQWWSRKNPVLYGSVTKKTESPVDKMMAASKKYVFLLLREGNNSPMLPAHFYLFLGQHIVLSPKCVFRQFQLLMMMIVMEIGDDEIEDNVNMKWCFCQKTWAVRIYLIYLLLWCSPFVRTWTCMRTGFFSVKQG